MICRNAYRTCLLLLLAAGAVACGQGPSPEPQQAQQITRETFREFSEHVVHFNAQSTTMLPPEVARAFGIQRGGNRAMLNVAVLRKLPEGGSEAAAADVTVSAVNLTGQLKEVRMRELREGDAIYYIGELTVSNQEMLTFSINVRPEGVDAPYQIRFRQQFYTD
jgi:hypothetical protein